MKTIILTAFLLTFNITLQAQVVIISNSNTTNCDFTFYDTGGVNASGYSANQDFTTTICPNIAGKAITMTWFTFNLGTGDQMEIFDGNSTTAPSLGVYTGTQLNNLAAYASPANATGCLTIHFTSDATGNGVFNASVKCETPCNFPVAHISSPSMPTVKLCLGDVVNFDGATSTAVMPFTLADYKWDFGDQTNQVGVATTASHTYTKVGRFIASLVVKDNNGCSNKNAAFVEVLVETKPKYTIISPTDVCQGTPFCIDASVASPPMPPPATNVYASGIHVPDNVGQCFESTQFYNVFPVGAHLTSMSQLQSIYASLSHTYVGDLIISIISPSGQSVVMHQQGGGGTHLGGSYYWAENAPNGTFSG
ncbi:MAG: PKD domain-containing protein [Bacteroidia bacterium]